MKAADCLQSEKLHWGSLCGWTCTSMFRVRAILTMAVGTICFACGLDSLAFRKHLAIRFSIGLGSPFPLAATGSIYATVSNSKKTFISWSPNSAFMFGVQRDISLEKGKYYFYPNPNFSKVYQVVYYVRKVEISTCYPN